MTEILQEEATARRQRKRQQRKQSHRQPVVRASGPLRPVPWQLRPIVPGDELAADRDFVAGMINAELRPLPALQTSHSDQRRALLHELWQECDIPWQLTQQLKREASIRYTWPPRIARPMIHAPLFVYVYSGRRREGDYQHFVEKYLHEFGIAGRVLLLDLALSSRHDVTSRELLRTLMLWIRQGAVAALLLAPPS